MKNLHVKVNDEIWDKLQPVLGVFSARRVVEGALSFVGALDNVSKNSVGDIITAIMINDTDKAIRLISKIK